MNVDTHTHCPYCALQCAMTLTPRALDAAIDEPALTVSGRSFPTNRGGLCRKGWTSSTLLDSVERIRTPLIRDENGDLVPVGWTTALDILAQRIRALQVERGRDSIGVFGGGGLTNEKAYQLGKFARVALGTSRIDYNGRFCMSSAAAAANRAFGIDRGLPFPVADLDAAKTVLLLGSNVAATMPPFLSHLAGARGAGGLIVVDPRRSATARLTEEGQGIHVAPAPGTDLELLLGLTHIVIAEHLYDADGVEQRTRGFDDLRRSVAAWWPARVQQVTGVPVAVLRDVARRLSSESETFILTGRGVEQHANGTDTATAAINLALILGLPTRAGSGYGTLTGQGNGQGGREHGQKCDQLPGYRKITDPVARAHVAAVWGVPAEDLPGPGLPAVQMLASIDEADGIRALLVHGSNPVISAPDAGAVRRRLGRLDLLVVCDFFLSETAAMADIVLPVTQWAEEEGTMTNLEGRVIRRRRAVEPPAGVRSELWIFSELARRLGAPGRFDLDPALVFDELARASAGGVADYSGLSHELLDDGREAYWPYPSGSDGTPRPLADGYRHPDGRARIVPVSVAARPENAPAGDQLTLITGRLLEHYQSGAQTRRVPELMAARSVLEVTMHPSTAADRGLRDGDDAVLENSRGTVTAKVSTTVAIRPDTVFLPFHFADAHSANLLTIDATDPVSGMPEFKSAVVRVSAVPTL
ncbi:molybdopterin oxidoreductase family protein [Microbacterium shaanxiense]